MSEDARQNRRPSFGQVMLLVLGGLVLYLLSPGPVLWLLIHAEGDAVSLVEKVFLILSAFYYPVELLQEHVPIIKSFYDAWFSIFGLGP